MVQLFDFSLKGDELHQKLGGGLPKSSFMLITAPFGLGKSILSQRITHGLLTNNHTVSYISTELPVAGFINQMSSVRYDVKSHLITKNLRFVSIFPSTHRISYNESLIHTLDPTDEVFESEVIIFDTFNELMLKKDASIHECFDLLTLFKSIIAQNKSIVFCVDPDSVSTEFFKMLQSASDAYLNLVEVEQYGNKTKQIQVVRYNSAVGNVEPVMAFKVRPGIGIVVELAS